MIARISASVSHRARYAARNLRSRLQALSRPASPRQPSKFETFFSQLERVVGGVAGKRVLEVGSDKSGALLRMLVEQGHAARAVGVNPSIEPAELCPDATLLKRDARDLPFPDASFDIIVSLSAFEHIVRLEEVLDECYRVLVPGGSLLAEFAPIWSGCWGHHLFLHHDGKQVDWISHGLPPYAHLLMTQTELRDWSDERFSDPILSEKIVNFVFDSPDQNRMFYSDYIDAFNASSFETVFIGDFADVPHPDHVPSGDYRSTFAKLRERYPDKHGFGNQGMVVFLHKPSNH